MFLCDYLGSEELRREIDDGLNVVERWNGTNDFIFFGKSGEVATNRLEDQEMAALALHLLQVSLVYINTLMFATGARRSVQAITDDRKGHGGVDAALVRACQSLRNIRAVHDVLLQTVTVA